MKRILMVSTLLLASMGSWPLSAQDAATQERLDKLSGQIENLIEMQRAQQRQIEALAREIEVLRDNASKPSVGYATHDDLKRLADSIKDVDRKRMDDADRVSAQLTKLGKTLTAPLPPPKKSAPATVPDKPEKGFPYTIAEGDTLSAIVQAYREKNIKVTVDQILKANPGLKAEKIKIGQEIWIPAPQ